MPRPTRLSLTRLEDRTTPATLYTVTGAGDDVTADTVLTLREALLAQRGSITLVAEVPHVTSDPDLTVDTIRFDPALGGRTITLAATDTLPLADYGRTGFVVSTGVAIDGAAGSGPGVTIAGDGTGRLFAVTASGELALSNLTLTGGVAKGGGGFNGGGGAAGLGGAVFVDRGVLTITGSTLTGNRAEGGAGATGTGGGGGGLLGSATSAVGGGPNGGTAGVSSTTPTAGGAGGAGGGGGGGGSSTTTSSVPLYSAGVGGAGGFGGGGGAGGLLRFNTPNISTSGGPIGGPVVPVGTPGGTLGSFPSALPGSPTGPNSGSYPPYGSGEPTGGGTTGGGTTGGGTTGGTGGQSQTITTSYGSSGPGGFGGGAGAGLIAARSGYGGGTGLETAGGGGGGLGGAVFNNAGTVAVTNSTLTANAAVAGTGAAAGKGYGGAVFSRNGSLSVVASTLSANAAADGGTDVYVLADKLAGGGGDTANTGAAALTVVGSILGQAGVGAANLVTATNGAGTVTATGSANLIRSTAVTGIGNLSTADPRLGALADNGGPTRTMAPLADSPARDAGPPVAPGGLVADQRGAGYVRVANGNTDIGAVELPEVVPTGLTPAALPPGWVGGAYTAVFQVIGAGGVFAFAVTAGSLPPGLTLSATGDRTAALAGTPTAAGTYSFTLTATDAAGNTASREFTRAIEPALVVGPTTLPAAEAGAAYERAFTASGPDGPFAFAVSAGSLPPGLTLSAAGTLAGTPTAAGTFAFTVTATAPSGQPGSRAYVLVVNPAVIVSPASLPAGQVGAAYERAFTAAGPEGPFTFAVSAGSLPAGLTLSAAGTLAGTPTAAGPATFTVTATNAAGVRGSRAYTLVVEAAVSVTPSAAPAAGVGVGYAQTFAASGPAGPFVFAVTAGSLPPGLALTPSGELTGTPTAGGTFPFTVTATSPGGATGSRAVVFTTAAGVTATTTAPATAGYGDAAVALTASVTGPFGPAGGGTVTFTVTDAAGNVVGTPASAPVTGGRATAAFALPPRTAAGAYEVTAAYSGTADLATSSAAAVLGVTPRGLTVVGVTAFGKVYDGTTTAVPSTTGAALVGVLAGDVVTLDVSRAAGTFAAKDVGAAIPVAVSGLALAGSAAANYVLADAPTAAATITPRALTVTGVTAAGKVYDGTTTAMLSTGAASLAGVLAGDVVTLDTGRAAGTFASTHVGAAIPVTVAGLELGGARVADYVLVAPVAAAAITPAVLSVTATDVFRAYGAPNPPLAADLAGFVGGDTAAVVSGVPALTTPATAASSAGTYPVVAAAGTLAAADYMFVFRPGVLTITPGATAVAAAPVAVAASPSAQAVTLTATVSGPVGPVAGGVVSFTVFDAADRPVGSAVSSIPVAAGTAVAAYTLPAGTAAGTYTVRAVYGGTADLAGSVSAAAALTVSPAVPASVDPPPAPAPAPGPTPVGVSQFAVGADAGGPAVVTLYDPDGSARRTFDPFPGTTGGVRTAVGDFNGDGTPDVAAGTGPGATAAVRVFDGATGALLFDSRPFADFTGGVFVAAGDVTGDGKADLVVTPDLSGGPRVTVFRGRDFGVVADFFGIDDPNFRGGARAAAGDLDGDGYADLAVSAGFGGGPRVSVYDGRALAAGQRVHPVPDFFLFEPALRNGAYVAVGDVDGDGFADLVGGGGPGGAPRVLAVSGRDLLGGGSAAALAAPLANFFAGDAADRGGVRVAVKNLDGDPRADVVVGSGTGAGSRVAGYTGHSPAFDFEAVPGFLGGVFVG